MADPKTLRILVDALDSAQSRYDAAHSEREQAEERADRARDAYRAYQELGCRGGPLAVAWIKACQSACDAVQTEHAAQSALDAATNAAHGPIMEATDEDLLAATEPAGGQG